MNSEGTTTLLYFTLAAVALMLLLSSFIIYFVFRYRKRQGEFALEKEQLRLEFQSEKLRAQLEISEQMMKNISEEIHDNIGATLTMAKLQLTSMSNDNYEKHAKQGTSLLTKAIGELRNLSKSLNGNYVLDMGLTQSIQRELNIIDSAGTIKCQLIDETLDFFIPEEKEIILFRCVQEALNNAVKHSEANEIKVSLEEKNKVLTLLVEDNGKGIDTSLIEKSIGFKTMNQRALILGGSFEAKGYPGKGSQIQFLIPFESNFDKN
jgi:two-component system, NarL family, sensor kinase